MRVRSRPSTLPQLPSPNYPLPITLTLFQLPSPNYPITHYPFYPIPFTYTYMHTYIHTYTCIHAYNMHICNVYILFESFDLLPRAWGPLPCRPVPCEPLPRVPGASPWGGSRHQSTTLKVPHAHLFFAYKFSSILMSVLGPLGVDLGSMLGVHFAPFGALAGLYWSQNRLRSVLISKT